MFTITHGQIPSLSQRDITLWTEPIVYCAKQEFPAHYRDWFPLSISENRCLQSELRCNLDANWSILKYNMAVMLTLYKINEK